jgi:hypothetical protein
MRLHFSDQPNFSNRNINQPMVFLAGPSPRDSHVVDWRDEAVETFRDAKFDGTLFLPRPSGGHMDSYDGQVEWELHHLNMADIIMFWVPRSFPEMIALTTNVEFGLYVKSGKIIYGRPDSAPKNRYLDHLYRKFTDREPLNDLRATVNEAINETNKIWPF